MTRAATLTRAEIFRALDRHEDLLRQYSVRRIGLFGSYVRDEPQSDSDVDFLVEFEKPTYDNFYDLSVSLERLFGRRVELVTTGSLSVHLKPLVEEEVAWHEVR